MPQLVEPTTPDAQREIIRQSLDEIAAEVATALRDAHLDFPVFLTVPNSGDSLATMACPLDPSDGRLVTCFSHRLSHHRATIGRRSAARTAITLRGGECDDGCRRCDTGGGERGMTVARCHLTASRSSSRFVAAGFAAPILFAMARFGYRPASVNVITHPFCLASGIWPRRVQNDRLIVV